MRHRKAILALVAAVLLGLLVWGGSGATSPEPAVSYSDPATTGLYTAAEGQEMMASAKCYMVGITVFQSGCGCSDLYVLRYLCYDPAKGWYYANYWYCGTSRANGGELDPGGWTSMYSFKGSTCSATNYIDPVTVVFKGATAAQVEQHAADHGDWTYHDGSSQLMFSYGYCYGIDGESNSEPGPPFQDEQYHMRLWEAKDFNGNPPCGNTYVLATPHHEDWTMPQLGCGSSWHSVYPRNSSSAGGFVEAREDILYNWVWHGPHRWEGEYWWGNDYAFKQSAGYGLLNGCWYAWSDGWVDYISLAHR